MSRDADLERTVRRGIEQERRKRHSDGVITFLALIGGGFCALVAVELGLEWYTGAIVGFFGLGFLLYFISMIPSNVTALIAGVGGALAGIKWGWERGLVVGVAVLMSLILISRRLPDE